MNGYVFVQVRPGAISGVLASLVTAPGVRRAVAVIGDWDILALMDTPDMGQMAQDILSGIQGVDGVVRTSTALVVPPDRVGIGAWGNQAPMPIADSCFVLVKAEVGAAAGLVERLADVAEVSGVAVLAGEHDLIIGVAQPWEVASGVILDQIHMLPGVRSTNTLVSVNFEEPEEDRDQFSTWS